MDGKLLGLSTEIERQHSGGFCQYIKSKADSLGIDGTIKLMPASKVLIVIYVEKDKDAAWIQFLRYLRNLGMVAHVDRKGGDLSQKELYLVKDEGFIIMRNE